MKSLNGVFIHASEEELTAIWTACAREGFTQDSEGVLKLLMLAVDDEEDDEEEIPETPDPIRAVADHLARNPEQAKVLADAARRGMAGLAGMFRKKGNPNA